MAKAKAVESKPKRC